MNWSGAKNWLIVLFVSINIFLIFTIVKSDMRLSVIDAGTIEQTVEILQRNNIFVKADIIPTKTPKLGAIDVQNSVADFDEFAKRILGEQAASLSGGRTGEIGWESRARAITVRRSAEPGYPACQRELLSL